MKRTQVAIFVATALWAVWPCMVADAGSGWYGSGGPIYLQRNRADSQVLSVIDNPAGFNFDTDQIAISTDNLDFDYEIGWGASVGTHLSDRDRIEVLYFEVKDHNTSAAAASGGDLLTSPFPGIQGTSTFTEAEFQDARYESELRNAELNITTDMSCCTSVLFGFRYFNLSEAFQMRSIRTNGVANNRGNGDYSIQSDNNAFGMQAGADMHRDLGDLLTVGGTAKGGVFLNYADTESRLNQVTDGGGNDFQVARTAHEWGPSTMLDLSLYTTLHVTENISVRGGYMVLLMNGVALAADQTEFVPNAAWGRSLDDDGIVVYDGAFCFVQWNR